MSIVRRVSQRVARPGLDARASLLLIEEALTEAVRRGRLRRLLEAFVPKRYQRELAQYLHVARLLHAGLSYRGIEDATRTSAKTIAGVDRFLRRESPHYRRLYPIRHRRQYRREGGFPDTALARPGSIRGQITALFGMDPRQR